MKNKSKKIVKEINSNKKTKANSSVFIENYAAQFIVME